MGAAAVEETAASAAEVPAGVDVEEDQGNDDEEENDDGGEHDVAGEVRGLVVGQIVIAIFIGPHFWE